MLTAKAEETQNWIAYAKACGREKDLIVFNAESGHCFDPLHYEWTRPGRGAGDLESIIDFFSTLVSIGKKEAGHGHDPFWERGNEQLMRNVIKLLDLAGERDLDRQHRPRHQVASHAARTNTRRRPGKSSPIARSSSNPSRRARTRSRQISGAISTSPRNTSSASGRPLTSARAPLWK